MTDPRVVVTNSGALRVLLAGATGKYTPTLPPFTG
ncbi:hypothetical protein JOD54_005630 [Actinokineospora baliensis]|nr:hypothetical protein [Actinokineospora baliensis]